MTGTLNPSRRTSSHSLRLKKQEEFSKRNLMASPSSTDRLRTIMLISIAHFNITIPNQAFQNFKTDPLSSMFSYGVLPSIKNTIQKQPHTQRLAQGVKMLPH